jgi:hypothetical protein
MGVGIRLIHADSVTEAATRSLLNRSRKIWEEPFELRQVPVAAPHTFVRNVTGVRGIRRISRERLCRFLGHEESAERSIRLTAAGLRSGVGLVHVASDSAMLLAVSGVV